MTASDPDLRPATPVDASPAPAPRRHRLEKPLRPFLRALGVAAVALTLQTSGLNVLPPGLPPVPACGTATVAPAPSNLATGSVLAQPAATSPAPIPAIDHVFLIVMENSGYDQVIGSSRAPYMTRLAEACGSATQYYGIQHGSLENYLALVSGQTFAGVLTNACHGCGTDAPSVVDGLEGSGRSWKGYMDSLPSVGYTGFNTGEYVRRHDPFAYFHGITRDPARRDRIVPFEQLQADLARESSTPAFSFISGDLCHDMHGDGFCAGNRIQQGDLWLGRTMDTIVRSPAYRAGRSLVVVTYDEDDFTPVNRVPTLFVGPMVRADSRTAQHYDHYSLLRTLEDIWGLPPLTRNDAAARPITDLFVSPAVTPSSPPVSGASPGGPTTAVTAQPRSQPAGRPPLAAGTAQRPGRALH